MALGRYAEGGPATFDAAGRGQRRGPRVLVPGRRSPRTGGSDFLPRLWATRKIGYLLNQIRLHGENPELVDAIVDLSLEFGIVTPYTSYLITEDDVLLRAQRRGRAQTAIYDAAGARPQGRRR